MHVVNSGDVANDIVDHMFGANYSEDITNSNSSLNGNNPLAYNTDGNGSVNNNNSSNSEGAVVYSDPSVGMKSINQEKNKYEFDNHTAKYVGNPTGKDLAFDISKRQSYDLNSWKNKLKHLYNKIERMFDNPVGLTNLRDQEMLLPNTSILAFNPAFTGGMLAPRFEMNYRNQWSGNAQNSQQMTLSYDNYFYPMRGGIGVVLNAKDYGYGKFNDYNLSLTYSPKIILSKDVTFEPAVKMTIGAMNANASKLSTGSQFELERGRILNVPTSIQPGNRQLWYKDYGLSFVLNTKWFYAGFSADNLNRHYENVYNQEGYATPTSTPLKLSAIIGTDYDFKRRPKDKPMVFSPFVAYQQFGQRTEVWGGFNYVLNKLTIGGSISQKKEFTAAIGMKFERFKLVYHYDQTQSALNNNKQIGSHNIGIRINGSNKTSRL